MHTKDGPEPAFTVRCLPGLAAAANGFEDVSHVSFCPAAGLHPELLVKRWIALGRTISPTATSLAVAQLLSGS